MQGQINTNLGNISIHSDVIAAYAGSVALGCTGIVGEWHPLICVTD